MLLALSYFTAALAIGMTINGSYYPTDWFANGDDSIIMNPLEIQDSDYQVYTYGIQIITIGDNGDSVTEYQGDDLRKLAAMKNKKND